jgi:hypothetical protein
MSMHTAEYKKQRKRDQLYAEIKNAINAKNGNKLRQLSAEMTHTWTIIPNNFASSNYQDWYFYLSQISS